MKTRRLDCRLRSLSALFMFVIVLSALDSPASQAQTYPPDRYDPIADPRAVVRVGYARFTVLTPQLIRMEWAADGKFEDHASLVFLNRKLPVPKFDATHEAFRSQQKLV